MNPMTNVKNIQKLNQLELQLGGKSKTSWHNQYKDSAWVFIGGLPYDLTEGDILAVFSQYGEIVNINLVRDKGTGKSKGFAFLCFEDQRSTILTVDNLNALKILGRTLRVDHCENYRRPKETGEEDDLTQQLRAVGCAPKTPSASEEEEEDLNIVPIKKIKKEKDPSKKKKKVKKEKKRKRDKGVKVESDSEDNNQSQPGKISKRSHDIEEPIRVKQEKFDPRYDKYATDRIASKNDVKLPSEIKQERDDESDVRNRKQVFNRSRDGYDRDGERGDNSSRGAYRESDRHDRDSHRERDQPRGRDRSPLQSRDRSVEHDRARDRDRDRSFAVRDRERKCEREGDRTRGRDSDRDTSRVDSRERTRDKESDRERTRDRENDRARTRDRENDRERTRDRESDRRRRHDR